MRHACIDPVTAERLALGSVDAEEREALLSRTETCDLCVERIAEATRRVVSRGPSELFFGPPTDGDPHGPHGADGAELRVGGLFAGRYVILDVLGRGGMGVVHLAHDTVLGREVALKVTRTHAEALTTLLRDEAQALGAIVHPNVVTVYDLAVDGERIGIAMERVRGMTLREWLHRFDPSRRRRVAALFAMSEGIEAAHRVGVVHGDVKLDNALVDAAGRVRVTDFGLGRVVGRTDGVAGGTAGRTAPEVGRGRVPTQRSDQYALATAWIDALTGAREGSPEGWRALARKVRPRWLRGPLIRALASEPERRFTSVSELGRRMRRARVGFVAALTSVLAVAIAGPWAMSVHRASVERSRCLAEALDGLPESLELPPGLAVSPREQRVWARADADYRAWRGRYAERRAGLCAASEPDTALEVCLETERGWIEDDLRVASAGGVSPDARAADNMRALGAIFNLSVVRHDDLCADPVERRALSRLAVGGQGPAQSGIGPSLTRIFQRGAYASPEELDALVAALSPELPSRVLATALIFRSAAHQRMQALSEAQRDAEVGYELATRLRRRDLMSRAAVQLGSLAVQERGDIRGARFWARIGGALAVEASWPGDRRLVAELEATIGVASGRATEVVAAVDALLADPHAEVQVGPRLLALRGLALLEIGALDEAEPILAEALGLRLEYANTDPSRIAGALHNAALFALAVGDLEAAHRWTVDAGALRAHLPVEHPDHQTLARTLARLEATLFGRHAEALARSELVLAATRARFPAHHVDILSSVGLAADLAMGAGDGGRARELAEEGARLALVHDLGGAVGALPFLVLAELEDEASRAVLAFERALERLGTVLPSAPLCLRIRPLAERLRQRHANRFARDAGPCEFAQPTSR